MTQTCVCARECVRECAPNIRHGPVAAAVQALQESGRSYLLAQVMVGIGHQPVVAVNQRDKGQRLLQEVELQLLHWLDRK